MTRRSLPATAAAVTVTSVVGGLATGRQSPAQQRYFRRLRKPRWQPPPVAFPIVWTSLYAAIAAGSAEAIDTLDDAGRGDEAQALRVALGANLALNAGWTWVFFRAQQPWLATAHSAVLAASSADLARRAGAASPRARALLLPYVAWTTFATALSGRIASLNPRHR